MLLKLNDITITQSDPRGELAAWLKEHWPDIEEQARVVWRSFDRKTTGSGNLYGPTWRRDPIFKLNSIYWPTGQSRHPLGTFLLPQSIYSQLTGSQVVVKLGNDGAGDPAFGVRMRWIHGGFPLLGAPSDQQLWIRLASFAPNTVPPGTGGSWPGSDVLPIASYKAMDLQTISSGRFTPGEICDIMGWSHHRRAVHHFQDAANSYDVVTKWYAASEGLALFDDQADQFKDLRIAGGITTDGPIAAQINFRHPRSTDYHDNRIMGRVGQPPKSQFEETIAASEFSTPTHVNYFVATGTSRPKDMPLFVQCMSLPYVTTQGVHQNATDIANFHTQWKDDYLAWTSRYPFIEYAGIVPWYSTGFEDYTLWECFPAAKTRVVGLPPTAGVGLNVAGYSNLQSDSYSMPDVVVAYCSAWSSTTGNFYLNRTGSAGSYTYSRQITQPQDPLGWLPPWTAGDFRVMLAWAHHGTAWYVVGVEFATVEGPERVGLGAATPGDTCLTALNFMQQTRTPAAFKLVTPAVPHGEKAARCGSYSGGDYGGGGGGLGDDTPDWTSSEGLTYQGDATYFLGEGQNPDDFKPPSYHPPGPPDDWYYFETESGTAWWYSPSTGIYIWVAD